MTELDKKKQAAQAIASNLNTPTELKPRPDEAEQDQNDTDARTASAEALAALIDIHASAEAAILAHARKAQGNTRGLKSGTAGSGHVPPAPLSKEDAAAKIAEELAWGNRNKGD